MNLHFTTLALSDGWIIGMAVAQTVVNVVMVVFMAWLKRQNDDVRQLKGDLRQHAEQVIDARFERVEQNVVTILRRLEEGDRLFRESHDKDHKLELQTAQAVSDLRAWCMANAATKDELKALSDHVQKLTIDVAQMQKV